MRSWWSIVLVALAMAAAGLSHAATLRVMGFGGSSNWPIYVAQQKGFFGREGLDVRFIAAPDSAEQMRRLMDGRIDLALTALDNVVAYREGEAQAPPNADRELVAIFGVNHGGRSSLLARADVATIPGLKGGRIAVDALSTGYAFVVEEILERGGLHRGDYTLQSVGGSRERWHALRDRKVEAALLNAPLDATAEAAGFRRLATSAEAVGDYQGSVGAVRRAWARAHEDDVLRFVRAYVAAMDWLHDPANAREAKEILLARQERMTPPQAERSYEELLDPVQGSLLPHAAIDVEGARAVLRLRSAHGSPARALGPLERYYDSTYYRRAAETPR